MHESAPDGVLELKGEVDIYTIPNTNVDFNVSLLVNEKLVYSQGISLEKQSSLQGMPLAHE